VSIEMVGEIVDVVEVLRLQLPVLLVFIHLQNETSQSLLRSTLRQEKHHEGDIL
jgi:hypothetical protein